MKLYLPFIAFICALTSCSYLQSPSIEREVTAPAQSLSDSPPTGQHQLVIFNKANLLSHGIDGTDKINVYKNLQAVSQLKAGQYLVLPVSEGAHTIGLMHKDVFPFESSHEISVTKSPTFLEVRPTIISNKAEIVDKPEGFESKYTLIY